MEHEKSRKIEDSDPKTMFYAGVKCYWGKDRRGAFELLSRAMEKGLPKDREYFSDDHSELNAALFLIPMLISDDGGCLSERAEPFWFEKQQGPIGEAHKPSVLRSPSNSCPHSDEYEIQQRVSAYLREIFLYVTARGGVARDLKRAADIAQDIVLELSFGDRDHDPAIELRSILQNAAREEREHCAEVMSKDE